MKTKIFSLILFLFTIILIQSCGTYKTFTGTVNYDASKRNEIVKSKELKSYLQTKSEIKFVLRAPPGFDSYSEEDKIKVNGIFGQIEKELIKNGHIVKDRILLERLLDVGDMSLTQVGKALNTDLIIEIIDLDFDIPNKIKNFRIKEKGFESNFDLWENIDYVDCRLAMLECRITLVEVGNVGGIFKFYISGCDKENEFYMSSYEEYDGQLDNERESYVGWNYGNVTFKSLTHSYDMSELTRNQAVKKLVKSLLNELTSE